MTETSRNVAEACQLTNRLWLAMDQRRHDDVLALLVPDCRWERDGAWQLGKNAIAASLGRRPVGLFIRHVLTNLVIDEDEDGLLCRYYLTVYATLRAKGAAPHLAEAPVLMADAVTRCVRVDGELFISEIAMTLSFLRPVPSD